MRAPSVAPLRIGVTPDYPPLVFMRNGQAAGLEVDFGHALGLELNRPVQFAFFAWDKQIDALLSGEIDIIMSGMTVTPTRAKIVALTHPYLITGLRALARREDLAKFGTATKLRNTDAAMGFSPGTTAETFVRQQCPSAQRVAVTHRPDAVAALLGGKLDIYIDEGFVIAEMYAANARTLAVLPVGLSRDEFAWAVRKSDTELLEQVNAVLDLWTQNGTLGAVIEHWMPDLDKIQDR